IAVANTGQANAQNVHVSDKVPTGLVFQSATANGQYNAGTNTVTWTLANVVAGAAPTVLTFTAQVPLDAVNGTTYDNTATFDKVHTPNCIPAGEAPCGTA